MAIDTAEKRRSVAGITVGWGITPNASKDAEWRAQVAWNYSGIAFGEPAVVVDEPAQRDGRDGGGGRKPAWWEGEWIIPGVTHYLPERPPEDIVPLRPKVDRIRERVREAKPPVPDKEYRSVVGGIGALVRQVNALETKAQQAVEEAAIQSVVDAYRQLAARLYEIESGVVELEAREERRRRIVEDDNQVLALIAEILP